MPVIDVAEQSAGVWSVASARAARQIRITASPRRGVGVLYALPKYFYAYRKNLRQPDKAAEVTTVIEVEVAEMGLAAEGAMADVLNGIKSRRAPAGVV